MNGGQAFSLERVSFCYRDRTHGFRSVLDRLSVSIASGCVTAIMGPSGAGKSTLGKLLAGELMPDSGELRVADALREPRHRFYVDQDPARVYFPWKTVTGNVRQPLTLLKWSPPAARQRVEELLFDFDLTPLAGVFPAWLSGGERSRLALARVLSWRPRALVLDEYLADLDLATRSRVIRALRRYVKESGVTIVLITHDPSDVLELADRCLIIGGAPGQIVEDFAVDAHPTTHDHASFRHLLHRTLATARKG